MFLQLTGIDALKAPESFADKRWQFNVITVISVISTDSVNSLFLFHIYEWIRSRGCGLSEKLHSIWCDIFILLVFINICHLSLWSFCLTFCTACTCAIVHVLWGRLTCWGIYWILSLKCICLVHFKYRWAKDWFWVCKFHSRFDACLTKGGLNDFLKRL